MSANMSWKNKANEEIVISYHNYLKLPAPTRQNWIDCKKAATHAVRYVQGEILIMPIPDALEHDKAFS